MNYRLALLLILVYAFAKAQSTTTLIHAGHVYDSQTMEWNDEVTITINGDKITKIDDGFQQIPQDVKYFDLKEYWVMPGLIDMHVHMESETNPKAYMAKYVDDPADVAYRSVAFAKATLNAGFTTVRDLGGSGINISLRDAINAGTVPGPRIFTAGKSIATTGGHADPSNGSNQKLMGDPGPREGVINSAEEARKAVRQRYKNGADCIKITATGGVLSVAKSGQNPQFTLEEVKALCDIAKDYGYHVAAHAHGDEGMQRAIKGGVTTIEHGTYMSDETMELMKEYGVYLVPTITAGKEVAEKAEVEGYYPDVVVPKALTVGPKIQGTFGRAYKKGVPIVFGTDAGVFKHGQNAREFRYMQEAGMPVAEALQTATLIPAKILKLEDSLGQLKQGFIADIIAVTENPEKNVGTLENVVFVMKDGVVYKSE